MYIRWKGEFGMTRILKAAFLSALVCSAMMLLACGDETSGLQSPDGDSGDNGEKKEYNAFIDKRDGNVYRVVKIGLQYWMAEDLRYMDKKAYPLLKEHSWCATSTERCKRNGYLYDFAAVVGDESCVSSFCDIVYPRRGICPEGWHVPEKFEWVELIGIASEEGISLGEYSEFATVPTGEYDAKSKLAEKDDCARYWTSSHKNAGGAFEYYRCGSEDSLRTQEFSTLFGYAVRCVADTVPKLDTLVEFKIPEKKSSSSSKNPKSSSSSEKGSDPESSSSSDKPESSSSEKSSSSEVSSCSSWESYVKDTTYNAFTDKRDGNVYRVYAIGSQVWMAENLRYADSVATTALVGRHWEWESNEYLYSFGAVMGDADCETTVCSVTYPHRGICPEGWHVPESSEWHTLVEVARSLDESLFDNRGFDAGWNYEYSAVNRAVAKEGPGYRYARFWSATQNNASGADEWYGDFNKDSVLKPQGYSKKFGYALRCVADSGEVKLDKHKDHLMSSSSAPLSSSSSSSTPEPEPKSSCDYTCNSSSSSSEPEPKSSCDYTCNSSSSSVPMSSCDYTCNSSSSGASSSSKPVAIELAPITDVRDGNQYRIVQVEKMMWMGENLRYADSVATPALKGHTLCIEYDLVKRCEQGNLYTYSAAVGNSECATKTCFESYDSVQGICPDGWRLPTRNDWLTLDDKVQANKDILTALDFIPTGESKGDGVARYDGYARFWLANEDGSVSAYEGYNTINGTKLNVQVYQKAFGYAVRCVQDVKVLDN